jgi:hypothetical protein
MDATGYPPILERTEDAIAWYARISSDEIPSPSLRSFDVQNRGVRLVFPKSYAFLRRLQRPGVNRLIKHGWTIPKSLFLEMPFLQSHYDLKPAEVGAWLIDVEERDVYYNLALFLNGYVSEVHQIELEDTVLHEMDHLKENYVTMTGGELPHGLGGGEEVVEGIRQEEREERTDTASILGRKYGKARVHSVLANEEMKLARSHFVKPVMFAVVAEYWLGRYCSENGEVIRDCENPMPVSMKRAKLEDSWADVRERSLGFYSYFAGVELP